MRFWPRSTADRVREAFAFLTAERGYRLVSASGATVAYRSPALWVVVQSDRGDAWVEVRPVGDGADGPYEDDLLRELVAGHATYEAPHPLGRARGIEEAAAFVRAHLAELEGRFAPAEWAATRQRLAALRAGRGQRTQAWLAELRRKAERVRGGSAPGAA